MSWSKSFAVHGKVSWTGKDQARHGGQAQMAEDLAPNLSLDHVCHHQSKGVQRKGPSQNSARVGSSAHCPVALP